MGQFSVQISASGGSVLSANRQGVYRDDAGSIIGFWGLTAQVSNHKVIFESKTRYAWCAWDTLFLPELLGTTLKVQSKCAETQKPILLEISPTEVISPSSSNIVLSMLVPDESAFNKDVISSFCHHVHFFATEEAGKRWVQDKDEIELLGLQDAFELGKMKNRYQFPATITNSGDAVPVAITT